MPINGTDQDDWARHDVFFGTGSKTPRVDWRAEHAGRDEEREEPTPAERRAIVRVLGFDPRDPDGATPPSRTTGPPRHYAKSSAVALKTAHGKLVSARSKTQEHKCSQAVSNWKTGNDSHENQMTLAWCRSLARTRGQAASHKLAGNDLKAAALEHRAKTGKVGIKARHEQATTKRAELARRRAARTPGKVSPHPAEAQAEIDAAKAGWSGRKPWPVTDMRDSPEQEDRARRAAARAEALQKAGFLPNKFAGSDPLGRHVPIGEGLMRREERGWVVRHRADAEALHDRETEQFAKEQRALADAKGIALRVSKPGASQMHADRTADAGALPEPRPSLRDQAAAHRAAKGTPDSRAAFLQGRAIRNAARLKEAEPKVRHSGQPTQRAAQATAKRMREARLRLEEHAATVGKRKRNMDTAAERARQARELTGRPTHRSQSAQRGSPGHLHFDPSKTNKEIDRLRAAHPGVAPETLLVPPKELQHYQDKYEFYMKQDSTDAARLRAIENAGPVPPLIVGGDHGHWWVTDGDHRLAVAAHRGQAAILAYIEPKRGGQGAAPPSARTATPTDPSSLNDMQAAWNAGKPTHTSQVKPKSVPSAEETALKAKMERHEAAVARLTREIEASYQAAPHTRYGAKTPEQIDLHRQRKEHERAARETFDAHGRLSYKRAGMNWDQSSRIPNRFGERHTPSRERV